MLEVYDCWGGLCWGEVVELMHEHKLVVFVNLCDIYICIYIYRERSVCSTECKR